MKKLFAVLLVAVVLATSSWSAERSEFLDGIVSVAMPAGWIGKLDDHEQTLTVGPEATPTTRLGFSTPSPNHSDPQAVTARNFDLIDLLFDGSLEIIEEDSNRRYGGKQGFFTRFTVDIMGTEVAGTSFAFIQDDYMVMALGMAMMDDFEKYFADFEKVIADYELNGDALARNADRLKEIADTMDQNHDMVMAELEAMEEEAAIEDAEYDEDEEEGE